MAKQLQLRRMATLTVLLALAFVGLGYRLVDLQVVRHGELAKEARSNTQVTYRLEPRRGNIVDCKGDILAMSIFVKTICADPTLMTNHQAEVAHAIAPFLQMDESDLAKRLTVRMHKNDKGQDVPYRYVLLKRKVTIDTWEKIHQAMTNLTFGVDEKKLTKKERAFFDALRKSSVSTEPVDDQLRIYPNGSLAAHVIGYVGMTDRTDGNFNIQVTTGLGGIENRFDNKLKGVRGWRVSEHDRQMREVVSMREQDIEPHDGLNVELTIDSVIQHILESALADGLRKHSPRSISGIVMRPKTGEILAMATLPTFDPNRPGAPGDAPDALNNRVISDVAEPGSTFKIVVVSGALNDGTVTLNDRFDCENGAFRFGGLLLHDHKRYGILSVKEIITKSSNIGSAKVGIKMGDARLLEYVNAFGFGRKTGIPLPAESSGIVHKLKDWTKVSISRIPMGHEVGATCLQMAMAMGAIANKGVLMQPMLVNRLVDTDGSTAIKYYPQSVMRVVSEDAAKEMVEALKTVVLEGGTATGAALTHYTVAGKTGTAQKAENGHYTDKFFSSFIGFFPADNPEVLIYVAMDAPVGEHYGGEVSAPTFKDVAEKVASYLNIRPDKDSPQSSPEMQVKPAEQSLRTAALK